MEPKKVRAILKWRPPTNVKVVRSLQDSQKYPDLIQLLKRNKISK
jgi:hypothetical protein